MEQVEVSINDFKAARSERQSTEKQIEDNGTEVGIGSAGKPLW